MNAKQRRKGANIGFKAEIGGDRRPNEYPTQHRERYGHRDNNWGGIVRYSADKGYYQSFFKMRIIAISIAFVIAGMGIMQSFNNSKIGTTLGGGLFFVGCIMLSMALYNIFKPKK